MEKIELKDINFQELEKLKIQGTKSTVYHNGDECIKILDKLYPNEKAVLYKKFLEMDEIYLDDVLTPKKLIINNGCLVGYTMDYFKNSINILDYLTSSKSIDCKDIFDVVKRASIILKKIHENDVIYQDLSFDNILINSDGNIKYSDIDGCKFDRYKSPFLSILLKKFLIDYRKDRNIYISENTDKISFWLSFYLVMYLQELQKIPKNKYYLLTENIKTLENCGEYANMLLKDKVLPELPYIHELIDDSDSYILDREKQLTLQQRILKKTKNKYLI